jgi:UDP-N-acetylglucosamine diphosphorylase/glucosamine-1-phosphate N-acetyltransferase
MSDKNTNSVAAVILAAGLGKRMKSDLPKVLHPLNDKYLVDYVIENTQKAGVDNIVLVVGHKYELVQEKLADRNVKFAVQLPQRGTGHAVQMAIPVLGDFTGDLLVLCGDMPLVSTGTIANLRKTRSYAKAAAVVLTVKLDDPKSYGRIIRDQQGYLEAIVEYKDASEEIRKINEVNTGAYCFDYQQLLIVLNQLKSDNAQGEYYLTDTIALLKKRGLKVAAMVSDDPNEGLGINSQEELIQLETLIKELKL